MISDSRKQALAFTALCFGFFMVILDVTIVNVALPSIAQYFSAQLPALQWVVDGYTLMFAGLLLLAGALSNRYGAKRIFQIGLVSFSIMSLACGLAASIESLMLFRFLQGAAGALMLPPSLSLINTVYSEKAKQAKAIGIWAALGGVACAAGPFLGGVLTHLFSWRAVFMINLLVGLVAFLLAIKHIDCKHDRGFSHRFDFKGLVLLFSAIAILAYSLIQASEYEWGHPVVLCGFISAVVVFIIYLLVERTVDTPLIPASLFECKHALFGMQVSFLLNLSFYGVLFSLPFYFENVRNYTVLTTGFALLPLSILAVIGSYLGGKATGKFGAGKVILAGQLVAMIGYGLMYGMISAESEYLLILIPFLLIGLGVSFTTPAMTFSAVSTVKEELQNTASATLSTINQIGSLIGVAVFGSVVNQASSLAQGVGYTFTVAASIAFLCAIIGAILVYRARISKQSS